MTAENSANSPAKARRKKAGFSDAANIDRLPPHSPEAEQGVLGCILHSPECLDVCAEKHLPAEAFYDLRHQTIYATLLQMHREMELWEIDIITIQERLKNAKNLEEVGGVAYLNSLPDLVPSAANLSYYLHIVLEKHTLRKLVHTCTEVVSRVYDHAGEVDGLMVEVERDFKRIFEPDKRQNCQKFKVDDLDKFDLSNDSDNLIGNGYATKGESIVVNGASGRGKSSLLMLRLMLWAMGRNFYGQQVKKPLKIKIFQAENNERGLAKAYQGARNFLDRQPFNEPDKVLLNQNLEFIYCPAIVADDFIRFAESEISRFPCDVAALDPLVSFCDVHNPNSASEFLRVGLSGISFRTGAIWIVNHHTPKPSRDPKHQGRKNISDYQYSGAGTFDIPGWARAVETLEEIQGESGKFRLFIPKRTEESGFCHPDGTPTDTLYLTHATEGGIHWEQINPPAEPDSEAAKESTSKKPIRNKPSARSKADEIAFQLNTFSFLSACKPEGESGREAAQRLVNWSRKEHKFDLSLNTAKQALQKMLSSGKLDIDESGLYRKGKNS